MNPVAALAIGVVLTGSGLVDLHHHDPLGWVSLVIGALGLATAYAEWRKR